MIIKRRFLTLVEMLIVIGMLSLIAGVVGVKINKMLQEQRFRTEVSQVVDQLRLAQDLMLIYDSNVRVKFIKTDNGYLYGMTFDNPLPENKKGWLKELHRPHKKLTQIEWIHFTDEKFPENNKGDDAEIQFLSGGSVMSRGLLILAEKEDKGTDDLGVLKRYVWLPGYPQPIVSAVNLPEITQINDLGSFETQLSQRTRDEIISKQDVKDQEAEIDEQKEKMEEDNLEKNSVQKEKKK